ncbi:unnamed protein product [Vicia faba]|uniref:Uncharacterized protein n=1 Tax=Vicia faba TaxID=3906 RepID=A0AAV1A0M2_VICFA|nr:unnamed protein product [Vicia faba]
MFSIFVHQLFVKIPLTLIYVNSTLLQELETFLAENLHCNITEFRIAWSWFGLYIIKSSSPFNALLKSQQTVEVLGNGSYDQMLITKESDYENVVLSLNLQTSDIMPTFPQWFLMYVAL